MLAHGLDPEGLHFDTGGMQESGGERAAREILAAGLPSTAVVRQRSERVRAAVGAFGRGLPAAR
jgi:hypothetical protein